MIKLKSTSCFYYKMTMMKGIINMIIILILLFQIQLNAQLAYGESKFLGNIYYKGKTPYNFSYYWNQVTPENAGKWASCEPNRDDMNYWQNLDSAYNYAKANGFPYKHHCLFFGHRYADPDWLRDLTDEEKLEEALEWIQAVCERYPEIDFIDVVNEPIHVSPYVKYAIGGEGSTGWDWVIWCFEQTRKYTNAKLLVNDYGILYDNESTENYLALINLLIERDLLDAIAVEAHSIEYANINKLSNNLDKLAVVGLPIYISEYDVQGGDSLQLEVYKQQFPLFWEHPAVKGVTLWGYIENETCREHSHLVRADKTERPALKWLKEYFPNSPIIQNPISSSNSEQYQIYRKSDADNHCYIRFKLPTAQTVSIHIFNTRGIKLTTLFDGFLLEGGHRINFPKSFSAGGVYIIVLKLGKMNLCRKFVKLRN